MKRTKLLRNAKIVAEWAALPKIPKEVLDQIVGDGPMTAQSFGLDVPADQEVLFGRHALAPAQQRASNQVDLALDRKEVNQA